MTGNELERLLGNWTLEDASWLADRLPAIVGGLGLVGLLVFLVRAPGNRRRFREHQARELFQRRTTAARLGLAAQGTDSARPLWEQTLDSVGDATEKIGPFPRFAGHSKVKILFEGDRNRFTTTVLVERISNEGGPETPDDLTTMICFASPDLKLPAFSLRPAHRMPALAEAAVSVVAKILKPLVRPDAPPEAEVDFDDRAFWPVYSVWETVSSLTDALAARDIRDVFTPQVRSFFVTRAGWSVEGLAGRLLLYRNAVEVTPAKMPAFLEEALAVAEHFRSPETERR